MLRPVPPDNFCQGGCTNQQAGGFLGALAGAAVGALLGAAIGAQCPQWYTIYDRSSGGLP